MKTINEIQDTINTLAERLSSLSADLDEMKAAVRTTSVDELARIERNAQSAPIVNKHLKKADELTKQTYMHFLAVLTDGNADKLLFARRIGAGCGSDWDAERLAAEALNIDETFVENTAARLSGLRYSLLLDSIVLAHLCGGAAEKDLELISHAADLLRCGEDDVRVVAQVAAAVTQGDKGLFDEIVCKKKFPGLSHLIPQEWFNKVKVGTFKKDYCEIKVKQNQFVKKGDMVVLKSDEILKDKSEAFSVLGSTFNPRRDQLKKAKKIHAPASGIITYCFILR